MSQTKYKQILQEQLIPFAIKYHDGTGNMIFQEYGCGPHWAKSLRTFLEAEGIELLPWLAQSPNINPIKNAWAIFKRKMRQESTYPKSTDDLFNRLYEIWDSIPSAYFERFIALITSRVYKLPKVKGLATKHIKNFH